MENVNNKEKVLVTEIKDYSSTKILPQATLTPTIIEQHNQAQHSHVTAILVAPALIPATIQILNTKEENLNPYQLDRM